MAEFKNIPSRALYVVGGRLRRGVRATLHYTVHGANAGKIWIQLESDKKPGFFGTEPFGWMPLESITGYIEAQDVLGPLEKLQRGDPGRYFWDAVETIMQNVLTGRLGVVNLRPRSIRQFCQVSIGLRCVSKDNAVSFVYKRFYGMPDISRNTRGIENYFILD
jgi:hypothetical protein